MPYSICSSKASPATSELPGHGHAVGQRAQVVAAQRGAQMLVMQQRERA